MKKERHTQSVLFSCFCNFDLNIIKKKP